MADDAREPTSDKSVEPTAETPATLPSVGSPSICPAEVPVTTEAAAKPAASALEKVERSSPFAHGRAGFVLLAASFVAVAAFGGVLGAFAMSFAPRDMGAQHERLAMQHSLTKLTQEITGLKADLAASEKTSRVQTARIADLDTSLKTKLARDQATITGSIATPAIAPGKQSEVTPLQPPKPQIETASTRHSIVDGWSVLGARRGFVYVRSGNEIYRIIPGDRLPGLGMVEDIRRDDLGWIVVTSRGLIVTSRRGGFDRF